MMLVIGVLFTLCALLLTTGLALKAGATKAQAVVMALQFMVVWTSAFLSFLTAFFFRRKR
jgi:hypothetical protein